MASELGAGTQQLDTAVAPGKSCSCQGGQVTVGDRTWTGGGRKQQVLVPPA